MDDKRIPLVKEEPKYKKKSKAKGLTRADHKHEYEPVLLHRPWKNPYKNDDITETISVNMVCKICGRIDKCLNGNEWYDTEDKIIGKYRIGEKKLNKKASKLPKWYTHDYWDKFAYKKQ